MIDWVRIGELESALVRSAGKLSRMTGEPADDVASEMRLALATRAEVEPDFVKLPARRLVSWAWCRAMDRIRRDWRCSQGAAEIDEEMLAAGEQSTLLDAEFLDAEMRELVDAIMEHADEVMTAETCRLNVSALARQIGKPTTTVRTHLRKMRVFMETCQF